jgi:uncharacterized protein (TIGR02145 family)
MKKFFMIFLFAFGLANIVLTSCNKECCNKDNKEEEKEKPLLFTIHIDVGAITTDAASCIVNLIPKPGSEETLNSLRRFGVMWDDMGYPILNSSDKIEESSTGTNPQYICHLTDLEPNTTYYVQGFVFFPDMKPQYYFSYNVVEFTTLPCNMEEEEGVVINGIRWATRNVGMPRTFTKKPEDAGMFYQWNRKVGWSSTDPMKNSNGGTGWNSSIEPGDTWEPKNDPCPCGWRVPTIEELKSLANAGSSGNNLNGVKGNFFGNGEETIFLPAAGGRSDSGGGLRSVGTYGDYWSSTFYDNKSSYYLYNKQTGTMTRGHALSIRCVAKEDF